MVPFGYSFLKEFNSHMKFSSILTADISETIILKILNIFRELITKLIKKYIFRVYTQTEMALRNCTVA